MIGTGFTADVYALGNDRVLKLFHADRDPVMAEREFAITHAVHRAGLPAPATYELVNVEGRRGIVFERIDGPSLMAHFERRPWRLFDGARMLADLHARLHAVQAPAGLPAQVDVIRARLATSPIPEVSRAAALRRLAELPVGGALCHGDFHPANIILADRGPVILDWSAACAGHPLGDVAFTSRLFRHAPLPPTTPLPARLMFKLARSLLHRTYRLRYLEQRGATAADVAAWSEVLETITFGIP